MKKGNTLGSRIKYVREKMNYTGEEFGKLLSVTKVAVSNWENDNRKPDVDMIVNRELFKLTRTIRKSRSSTRVNNWCIRASY